MSNGLQVPMFWPQFHLALTSLHCSPPCSLGPQPHWPPRGSLSMLGVLRLHSIGTFQFPYLLQASDQLSNVLQRPIWLPILKLRHLHNAVTWLPSFLNFFFFFFYCYCYSITVVCILSPSVHHIPDKPTSLPHLHPPPSFCPCVLYSSSWKPFAPPSLPPSPLAIVRLFLTSMSLVIFCKQNFWLQGSLSQKTARPAWFRTKGSWGLPGGLDLLVVVFDFGGSGPKPHWTITDLCICCASYVRYLPQKGGREDLAGLGGMEVILGSRSSTGTPLLTRPKSFLFPNKYWQEYW